MKHLLLAVLVFGFFSPEHSFAAEKKFKRALVMGGMGVAPGIGLGMIAGLTKSKHAPDLIIATCGSAMAAAIYSAYPDATLSLDFAKSPEFKAIIDQTKIETKNLLKVQRNFARAKKMNLVPPIFSQTILHVPEVMEKFLPDQSQGETQTAPKIIILSARSHFGPEAVGKFKSKEKTFTQVFFTDKETGSLLKDYRSPIAAQFPDSNVAEKTAVMTSNSLEEAARASISDPFLLNPGKIDGAYYFTGAVDLFPLELAAELADEVISNYPLSMFTDYEDLAIRSTFGFNQTASVLHDIQNTQVKWVDLTGSAELKFDPYPKGLSLRNGIPFGLEDYQTGIQAQWDLGYTRAIEAIDAQTLGPSKKHLRNPLERYLK